MRFFKKNLSILIVSTDYWRFRFFTRLFGSLAHIKHVIIQDADEFNIISDKGYDLVIWELELGFKPPENFQRDKILLSSYRDESNLTDLQFSANLWNLPQHRFMQLVANKSDQNIFPLPLPPPKIYKRFSSSPKTLSSRKNNLFFLCSATYIYLNEERDYPYITYLNNRWCYNQRLEWISCLIENERLPPQQGLIESNIKYLDSNAMNRNFNFSLDAFVKSLDRKAYSEAMLDSKLILCPGGHSRWTYRHFEGFFNRGLVVSTSFANIKTTPAIPTEAYLMIEDGAFSTNVIDEYLSDLSRLQKVADFGYQYAQDLLKPKSLLYNSGYKAAKVREMFNSFSHWLSSNL